MRTYDAAAARAFFEAKVAFTTGTHEVQGMLDRGDDVAFVDVRMPSDYEAGHVPGAVNLPRGTWQGARGLPKERPLVLYCYSQTCHMAAEAALELLKQGYAVQEMEGGFATWKEEGYPVEAGSGTRAMAAAT
jgi:rhodanese-related sulfurtransferase